MVKEREKYQHSTQAISSGLSAIPVMTVNDSVYITVYGLMTGSTPFFSLLDFTLC